MRRPFAQVDVFTDEPLLGNPVAVVLDGDGLTTEQLQAFAAWTDLSETTFVLPPQHPEADYRVRIFTPTLELPFAGHPTLGTCHAWLAAGGTPRSAERVVQECGVGLVEIDRGAGRLAFVAPGLIRSGEVSDADLDRVVAELGIERGAVVAAQWVDNGPGWVAVELADADAVLAVVPPGPLTIDIGVVGFHRDPGQADDSGDPLYEVRAFFPKGGIAIEDPVTGSLNASLAQWFTSTGRVQPPYVTSQGTALARRGRVHITADAAGRLLIGGGTVTCIEGWVAL